MRFTNDSIVRLAFKHFGNYKDNTPSKISLIFYCLIKFSRDVDAESFYEIFTSIYEQNEIDGFHKRFRQIDNFKNSTLDSLFYNTLGEFKNKEWQSFDSFMQELMEMNNKN